MCRISHLCCNQLSNFSLIFCFIAFGPFFFLVLFVVLFNSQFKLIKLSLAYVPRCRGSELSA